MMHVQCIVHVCELYVYTVHCTLYLYKLELQTV